MADCERAQDCHHIQLFLCFAKLTLPFFFLKKIWPWDRCSADFGVCVGEQAMSVFLVSREGRRLRFQTPAVRGIQNGSLHRANVVTAQPLLEG